MEDDAVAHIEIDDGGADGVPRPLVVQFDVATECSVRRQALIRERLINIHDGGAGIEIAD